MCYKYDLSFVVPFYKKEDCLIYLLKTILKSNRMGRIACETVIVCDSPMTEETMVLILDDFKEINPTIVPFTINKGVAKSRDIGMERATGKYITFIDQDDFISDEYLKSVGNNILNKSFDILWLNGYLYNVLKKKKIKMFFFFPKYSISNFINGDIIPTPSFLVFRSKYLQENSFSFYNEEISSCTPGVDDWFLILQTLLSSIPFKIIYNNALLVFYCIHGDNFSSNKRIMLDSKMNLISYLQSIYPNYFMRLEAVKNYCLKCYDPITGKKMLKIGNPKIFLKTASLYLRDFNRTLRLIIRKFQRW